MAKSTPALRPMLPSDLPALVAIFRDSIEQCPTWNADSIHINDQPYHPAKHRRCF